MQSTHVGLYSYLPLSLNGPKGEGDQGGEGSPEGLGRIPSPKVWHLPLDSTKTPVLYYRPGHRPRTSALNTRKGTNESRETHIIHDDAPYLRGGATPPRRTSAPPPHPLPSHHPATQPPHTTSAAQRLYAYAFAAINHRPAPCMEGPRTNHGTPSPRAAAKCAPHSPGAKVSPLQATPRSTASQCSPGP